MSCLRNHRAQQQQGHYTQEQPVSPDSNPICGERAKLVVVGLDYVQLMRTAVT